MVRVREGTLLLFPSYLEHSVDANRSDDERVSISFNLMLVHAAAQQAAVVSAPQGPLGRSGP